MLFENSQIHNIIVYGDDYQLVSLFENSQIHNIILYPCPIFYFYLLVKLIIT